MDNEKVLSIGLLERIGLENSLLKHQKNEDKFKFECSIPSHKEGISLIIEKSTDNEVGVISSMEEINAVGHRVVHAGEEFAGSVKITDAVMNALKKCIPLAPLHNPANIMGIEACVELMPNIPQVGVFDTAFHQTMEPSTYLYAIPYEYYEKHKIRRYGFHGTSHRFVSAKAAKLAGKPYEKMKIITCHLGNGASIAAIKNGKSVDTSMGFTPLEGLVMGTRCGDIDPAIPMFLQKHESLTAQEVDTILNKKSGVKGISGVSSDMRDIENAAWNEKNERAQMALDIYHKRVIKYIGAYAAEMNGVDAIVFTGGIGENGPETREEILNNLTYLGIEIDKEINNQRGKEIELSTKNSKVKVFVIPTNEELVIARDTKEIIFS
jgi:acetate kinase